jgi:hypothetical protein
MSKVSASTREENTGNTTLTTCYATTSTATSRIARAQVGRWTGGRRAAAVCASGEAERWRRTRCKRWMVASVR